MTILAKKNYYFFMTSAILCRGKMFSNDVFFYKEDLLTYKNLQKYATKYIHMYNMKYNKMAA